MFDRNLSSIGGCSPLVAASKLGIPGIGGGGEVGPLKRLLGGVGVFFGRSKGAVPGRGISCDAELSMSSGVLVMSASLPDASLELSYTTNGFCCEPVFGLSSFLRGGLLLRARALLTGSSGPSFVVSW